MVAGSRKKNPKYTLMRGATLRKLCLEHVYITSIELQYAVMQGTGSESSAEFEEYVKSTQEREADLIKGVRMVNECV